MALLKLLPTEKIVNTLTEFDALFPVPLFPFQNDLHPRRKRDLERNVIFTKLRELGDQWVKRKNNKLGLLITLFFAEETSLARHKLIKKDLGKRQKLSVFEKKKKVRHVAEMVSLCSPRNTANLFYGSEEDSEWTNKVLLINISSLRDMILRVR